MFPRRDRLSRTSFPRVSGGQRVSSRHFSLVIPTEGSGYAVVIPKKAVRLSVTRHRIKRRVLHALRTLARPASLVVFPRAEVARLPYPALHAELAALLSKVRETP